MAFIGPTYTQHNPRSADGVEGLKAFIGDYLLKANPGLKAIAKRVVVEGDLVVRTFTRSPSRAHWAAPSPTSSVSRTARSCAANLAGVRLMHQSFAELGLPAWFGYFIGACEVAGAMALFLRPLSATSAMALVMIMGGAEYYHVAAGRAAQGLPALVLLLLLCVYIAMRRRAWAFVFR